MTEGSTQKETKIAVCTLRRLAVMKEPLFLSAASSENAHNVTTPIRISGHNPETASRVTIPPMHVHDGKTVPTRGAQTREWRTMRIVIVIVHMC